MSQVFSVRFSDDQAALIEERGGSSWIKEQVIAILDASSGPMESQFTPAEEPEPATENPRSADEEQELRDHFGYSSSEKRAKAERDEVAARIVRDIFPAIKGELPAEVKEVWGHSTSSMRMACSLISAWGLDVFLDSQVHKAARAETSRPAERQAYRDTLRSAT